MSTLRQLAFIPVSRSIYVLIIILFSPGVLFSQKVNLSRRYPVITAENQLWLGTPVGLLQYNVDDDSYKRFTLPLDQPQRNVKQLFYYDEWLWCVLDSGLAALHIRLNEWLIYDTTNGLPSNIINGIACQEGYIWIATDNGAARFDLLIEEWEIYNERQGVPDSIVNDILVIDDNVWLITKQGFSEYDPRFEKWRHYRMEQDSTAIARRAFILGDELWLVSDNGLIRFNPDLQTQQDFFQSQFLPANLIELFVEDDILWVVSRDGLYYYNQESGVWREFEGNSYLKNTHLINAYIDRGEIWISTDRNVLVWDRSDENWEILDYASGLSTYGYQSLYVDGKMVHLIHPQNIDYRLTEQDTWRKFEIKSGSVKTGGAGKQLLRNLFDNEAGGYIPLGKYKWGWEGTRITYIYDYEKIFSQSAGTSEPRITSGERLDIKNQITLNEYRTITGFYNNIDYSETEYGIRYRSRANDFLRELNWGDFRRDQGSVPFTEEASVFGSNIWLQTGPKTSRFKRSRFSLKAHTGEQRSQKTYEYFQGATDQSEVSFKDIDYIKNEFYAIPDLDTLRTPEQFRIYVDDLDHTTNTANTIENMTIANVTGDFDLLKATEDYYFYEKARAIRFLSYIESDWTVVVRYSYQGIASEVVLKYSGTINTARKNIYYLGGPDIIPYSFQLTIADSLGNAIPLQNFQIDANGDNRVDSEWIDYQNGLLIFPQEHPFPSEVYDPDQPQSFYQIRAQFRTELSIIQLKNRNLVRGSEVLKLDGTAATAGNDYILDYTNGTLVFVKEGVVSSDTRIEIEYEYYIGDGGEQLHSATLNWSPSDYFFLQGDWLQFSNDDSSMNTAAAKNLLTLSSEMRRRLSNYDLKIIPGLAYNPEENGLAGANLQGLVSSSNFRFQSIYQNYSRNYQNLYRPRSIFGDVKSNLDLSATADVFADVRLSAEWNELRGYDEGQTPTPKDKSSKITFLFHKRLWPVWRLSYQEFQTESSSGHSTKKYVQTNLEYQLPKSWSKKLNLHDIKMEAFLRTGQESGFSNLGSDKTQFHLGYVRLNTMISERFQGSLFYRRNDLNDISSDNHNEPIHRSERFSLDLAHEEWRTVQVNLRVENKMTQNFQTNSSYKNVNLNNYSQINMRFSPGQIWKLLLPVHFEFNLNQYINGWGAAQDGVSSWLWELFTQDNKKLDNARITRNFYIKNELRPSPRWYLSSLIEWNDQKTELGSSALTNHFWRWSENLNLKLGFKTRLNLQYRQFFQNWGYDRTDRYIEPSTWIEHRWTPDFQNNFYLLYRRRQTNEQNLQDISHNWEVRYDIIWRKHQLFYVRHFEIRQSFAGSHCSAEGINPQRNYQLNSGSSIDLYPLHSTILRLQFDLIRFIDDLLPDNNYWNMEFNLKLSFRF